MEALINLESQMPDLAVYQHLLVQLEESDQGMNMSCLQMWLQKAVLKAKEIDFRNLSKEVCQFSKYCVCMFVQDPAIQQVQWLFEYCYSKSIKAAKTGNYQIAVLFAESLLKFHDCLELVNQSEKFLLGTREAKFQVWSNHIRSIV